jgi:hypothetical protein
MITSYNPSRGVDLYVDSSGEDDWNIETGKYYLHGLMLCLPTKEWNNWIKIHQTKYDGMIHWSDGRFGKKKQKLENVKANCRELIAMNPWFKTIISVFDKKAVKEMFLNKYSSEVEKYDVTKAVWESFGATALEMVIPHLKAQFPNDPLGHLNVRHVIINNPKGGDKSAIENVFKTEVGRTPEFVPAGHYGIDALDGILWAFHRCLNLGKTDCLPEPIHNFNENFNVLICGVKSDPAEFW